MNDKRHDRGTRNSTGISRWRGRHPGHFRGRTKLRDTRDGEDPRGTEPWYAWAWRLLRSSSRLPMLARGVEPVLLPLHPADPVTMLASGAQEVALLDQLTGE